MSKFGSAYKFQWDKSKKSHRQVKIDEAFVRAEKFNAFFIETSAKSGEGIQKLFTEVTQLLLGGKHEPPAEQRAPEDSKFFFC